MLHYLQLSCTFYKSDTSVAFLFTNCIWPARRLSCRFCSCRVVVNGQRDFAFILTHYFGQQLILRPIKSTVVACGLPIRRVGVKNVENNRVVSCGNQQRCLHFRLLLEDPFEQLFGIVKNVDRHGKPALFLIMTDSCLKIIQAKIKVVRRRKSVNNATISYI